MKDVLIVLNPRRIDECLSAIESLPIDKIWVRNLSEPQIVDCWSTITALCADYEWAWILSDDACPRPHALEVLRELAADLAPDYPVVTGYSNLDRASPLVNLTRSPLDGKTTNDEWDLYTFAEVAESEDPLVPTSFAGFSLTGMSVAMWEAYPYQLEHGLWSADFNLSKRLERDGVPIVAHRDAFVWHVKEQWSRQDEHPRKRLMVGELPAAIDLERVMAPL